MNLLDRARRRLGQWLRSALLHFPIGWQRSLLNELILNNINECSAAKALCFLFELDTQINILLNQKAIEYNGGIHVKHRLTGYHRFFIERIKRGEKVLDVGCGKGELAYDVVVKTGESVTAIDMNPEYLAFARNRFIHPNLTYIEGDALAYVPPHPFDVVILSNVLEHIEHRIAFLRKIAEQTCAKRFLIRVPMFDRDWRVPLRKELGLPYFSDVTHYIEYTQESIIDELRQAGLKVTDIELRWGETWAEAIIDAKG